MCVVLSVVSVPASPAWLVNGWLVGWLAGWSLDRRVSECAWCCLL